MKNIYFIILSIIVIFYILLSIRNGKLSIKTSFGWFIACIIMLILSIFPRSLDWLAKLVGISYAPTLFLTLCVILLLIQNFNTSKKIYNLEEKNNYLEEEITILKGNNKK